MSLVQRLWKLIEGPDYVAEEKERQAAVWRELDRKVDEQMKRNLERMLKEDVYR